MARKPLRSLVSETQLYLYSAGSSVDLDGERVVSLALWYAETGKEQQPRGLPMRANFLAREPDVDPHTVVVEPWDVRFVLEQAHRLGWDGKREGWLLPGSGLDLPKLTLSGPTRLRAWSEGQPVYVAHVEAASLAERLARELGLPAVPAAKEAAEAQWRDSSRYMLRSRWGRLVHIYTRSVGDLHAVLAAVARRGRSLGVTVGAVPCEQIGPPASAEITVVPAAHWADDPAAEPYPGPHDMDVVWAIAGADGPRVEAYEFAEDAPERLRRWVSLGPDAAIDRRFAP